MFWLNQLALLVAMFKISVNCKCLILTGLLFRAAMALLKISAIGLKKDLNAKFTLKFVA
ncbi:hypothetical protein D3C87_1845130 [compost metagenome]